MDSSKKEKIIIILLWALSVIPWYWSTTHLDIARDLVHANAIAEGDFIGRGPIIGGLFYLAPYWFYLLAVPIKLGFNWLGTILFIGVLSGLKFPLAYWYFKANNNSRAGLIACFLLLILGWVQHQWLVPTHTVMTSAAVFALLIMFKKMAAQTNLLGMFSGGVFFGLCFHAHPTLLPMGVLVFWSLHQQSYVLSLYLKNIGLFALGALLIVSPIMLLSQSGDVTYSPTTFMAYLGDLQVFELLKRVPIIFKEIIWGEFGYVVKTNVIDMAWLKDLVRYILILTILIMTYHLIRYLKPLLTQYLHVGVALLLMMVFVAIIREQVTFYMIWSSAALLVVLIAHVLSLSKSKPVIYFVQFSCLVIWSFLALLLINNQSNGSTYFDFSRMYGFSLDNKFVTPVYMISAGDRDAVAKRVCADDNPVIHGALLNNLVFDYQGGERFWCPEKEISLSGVEGERHLTFMPAAMVQELGVQGGNKIGGVFYFNSRPVYPAVRIEIGSGFKTYLPKNQYLTQQSEKTLLAELSCGELLVIHHAYHFLSPLPALTVSSTAGVPIKLLAKNENTFIYGCTSDANEVVSYQIEMKGKGVENMDISAVKLAQSP